MYFSLITTTFNSVSTITDTLNSVLNQSYTDYEYIIVDGGSTDGTLEVIKKYEPLFNGRLHWSSEPDHGIYDAMNKGIHQAHGIFVGLLNSDDFFSSHDVLQKQLECLQRTDADAVFADVLYVDKENINKKIRYYSSQSFSRIKMRLGFMPAHPTFYCKKEVYERYGYFDLKYKVAADFECLLRFIYVHRIRCVYNPLQVVTMRTGGSSNNGWTSHRQIMNDHLLSFSSHHLYANTALLSLRYVCKVADIVKYKLKKKIE